MGIKMWTLNAHILSKFAVLICLALFCVSCSAGGAQLLLSDDRMRAEKSIGLCISEYEKLSGAEMSDRINRSIVLVAPDRLETIFVRGESGQFGERSPDFEPFFLCGYSTDRRFVVTTVLDYDGMEYLLLTEEGKTQIAALGLVDPIPHYIFVRNDANKFEFSELRHDKY